MTHEVGSKVHVDKVGQMDSINIFVAIDFSFTHSDGFHDLAHRQAIMISSLEPQCYQVYTKTYYPNTESYLYKTDS